MKIIIRQEREEDYSDVKRVIKAAFEEEFGQDNESGLVEKLRKILNLSPSYLLLLLYIMPLLDTFYFFRSRSYLMIKSIDPSVLHRWLLILSIKETG